MLPQGTGNKLKTAGIDVVSQVFDVPLLVK